MSLRRDIESAINRNRAENGSSTPDYILAAFLTNCLMAFDQATRDRDEWHGFDEQLAAAAFPPGPEQEPSA